MPDDKRKLQTIYQDINGVSGWYMYNSMEDRDKDQTRLVTPNIMDEKSLAIINNSTYQKHIKREQKNNQDAWDNKTRIKWHEIGYRGSQTVDSISNTLTIISLVGGLFLGGLAKLDELSQNSDAQKGINISAFTIAIISLAIATISLIAKIINACLADKHKREVRLFKSLKENKKHLPEIKEEIELKERVIRKIINFLKVDNTLQNSPSVLLDSQFFEYFAIALDKNDDLNRYSQTEKVLNQLSFLEKDKIIGRTIRLMMYGYLRSEFYLQNIGRFNQPQIPTTIIDFINLFYNQPMMNFLSPEMAYKMCEYLIRALESTYKLAAATRVIAFAEKNGLDAFGVAAALALLEQENPDYKKLTQNIDLIMQEPNKLAPILYYLTGQVNNNVFSTIPNNIGQLQLFVKLLQLLAIEDPFEAVNAQIQSNQTRQFT